MEIKLQDFVGSPYTLKLEEFDISHYDVLFHFSPKVNRVSIEKEGLKINQPTYKSLIITGLLFLSYPVDRDTSDCFRWHDSYSLYALDSIKLREDGFIFYKDPFSGQDQSSKNNHLCCTVDIPPQYIKKVFEF